MSLNRKKELVEVAKQLCRELRKNSTEAEKVLWEAVRNKKFYGKKFYRQYPIFLDITGQETFFVADFYCHSDRLIIELDGRYHQYKLKEDEDRTSILNYLGLKVIRFSNDEILNDLSDALKRIKSHLEI